MTGYCILYIYIFPLPLFVVVVVVCFCFPFRYKRSSVNYPSADEAGCAAPPSVCSEAGVEGGHEGGEVDPRRPRQPW